MSGSSPVLLGAAVAIMIAASPSMRDPAHRSGSNVVVCDANTTHGLDVLDAKWSNCTHVVGDLSPPNVHAFGVLNLSSVVSVTGYIKLGMSSFSSIDLSGLVSVGGDVDIFSNDELEAVDSGKQLSPSRSTWRLHLSRTSQSAAPASSASATPSSDFPRAFAAQFYAAVFP